jgi:3-oxoacyl-[acyl-carrier protein] reductase
MIGIDLSGEAVVITGASRGIGRAMAKAFATAGASVLLNYLRDDEAAQSLAGELAASGADVLTLKGSVADPIFAAAMVKTCVDRWGRIDCLINNAGITRDNYFTFLKEDDWRDVVDVNLNAVFYTCRSAIKPMIARRKGVILNLSSISATTGREGQVPYSAAKAGLLGFTRSLAREVGRYDVRVNALVTGMVDTDMTKRLPRKVMDLIVSQTPLRRIADPAEIAGVAVFLASGLASFVTGSCIEVDGGL